MKGRLLVVCSLLLTFLFPVNIAASDKKAGQDDAGGSASLKKAGYVIVMNVELPHNTLSVGFTDKLKAYLGPDMEVFEERISIAQISDTATIRKKYSEISAKYSYAKPAAIVFYGTLAMVSMSPLLDGQWKGIPMVCVSRYNRVYRDADIFQRPDAMDYTDKSNFVPIENFLRRYNATVVYRPIYIYEDLKLIFTLKPKTKKVVLVTDGEYDRADLSDDMLRIISEKYPSVEFQSYSPGNTTTEHLLQAISSLAEDSAIIMDSWDASRDSYGDNFMQKSIFNILTGISETPLFILEDIPIDKGKVLGGCYLTEDQIADAVASTLEEIFSGTPASSIPSRNAGTPRTILDYFQLAKYGVPHESLPTSAYISNSPPSFYERNRFTIWIVLAMLAAIVVLIIFNVKRQRRNREKMKDELDLNRRIISTLDGVVDMVSKDGHFIGRLSSSYLGFMQDGDDWNTHSLFDYVNDPKVSQQLISVEDTAIKSKSVQRTDFTLNSKGRTWYLSATFIPVYKDDECMLYVKDVSSRIERENRLQQYQQMIETILDNLPLAVSMKDVESGKYIVWNKSAEFLWHIKPSDALGHTSDEIFSQSNAAKFNTYDRLTISGEHIVNDIMSVDANGKTVYGLVSKILLKYAMNDRSWILSSFLDITEMKENEKIVEQLSIEYNLVQQALGIATWSWNIHEDTLTTNFSYFSSVGSSLGSQSKSYKVPMRQYLDSILDDDRKGTISCLQDVKDGAKPMSRVEYRVRSFISSKILWLESYCIVSERDESGAPTKIIGVTMDIAERKKSENALVEAKAAAEESNRLKSYFLADISHEIRTPLNSIVGFSNIIADTDDPEERKAYAEIIRNNNTMLLRLINDILDMSTIEAGITEFSFNDVDVNKLISEVCEGIRFKTPPVEGVKLILDTPMDECIVRTDRNRLSQVLTNFMTNAVKFTKKGSITLGYKMLNSGSKIRFYCTDTGCGIAQENVNSIFGKFVKINPNSQGSGIGLSLCEVIVHYMKGEIGVDSKLGEGSTFWADFPYSSSISLASVDNSPASAELDSMDEASESAKNKKVLVAEDNDSNFRLMKSVLGKRYDIIHAWNGREAVEMFKSENPDLILMDIKMPVMDGYEATDEIRKISKEIGIIAVTAYASAEDEKRIKSGGFSGFLAKPINFDKLRSTVFNALYHNAE